MQSVVFLQKGAGLAESEQSRMVSAALRHPIRVRALEAMQLRQEISATSFVSGGMGKDLEALRGRTPHQQISDVSYHLRALEKVNCVSLTREEKKRGGVEKFYRANAVAYFSDEEWATLPLPQRQEISRVVAQGFIVQVEGAILAGTFDSRTDRWLYWEPLALDDAGRQELSSAILSFHLEVAEIREEAARRLAEEEAAEPIWTTFGVAAFESPTLPDSASDDVDGPENADARPPG